MDAEDLRRFHSTFKEKNPSKITLKVGTKFSAFGAYYQLMTVESHKKGTWNVRVFSRATLEGKLSFRVMTEEEILKMKSDAEVDQIGDLRCGTTCRIPGVGRSRPMRQGSFRRSTSSAAA